MLRKKLAEERLKKEKAGKGIKAIQLRPSKRLIGANCAGVSPRYLNECLQALNINK